MSNWMRHLKYFVRTIQKGVQFLFRPVAWLLQLPPWFFGSGYIFMVFAFAYFYVQIADEFRHNNAQTDPNVAILRDSLEQDLQEAMVSKWKNACDSGVFETAEYSMCVFPPSVTIRGARNNVVLAQFLTRGGLPSGNGSSILKIQGYFEVYTEPVEIPSGAINPITVTDELNAVGDDLGKLYWSEAFGRYLGGSNYAIDMPRTWRENMKSYNMAFNGRPYLVEGQYSRMLYLSAVTQTTLGFGDIVPVGETSRALVGSQAFLGVLVVGLFLNALARKHNSQDT
ncbi:MAG: potassium channel family protein [Pseudomonadota bacterium]